MIAWPINNGVEDLRVAATFALVFELDIVGLVQYFCLLSRKGVEASAALRLTLHELQLLARCGCEMSPERLSWELEARAAAHEQEAAE